MTKLIAYEDPAHEGNSAKYHSGKPCREAGCKEPAGTWWSPLWCFRHNVERIKRIDAGINDLLVSSRLRTMVDAETQTLRDYCDRLVRQRDEALAIAWRRITDDDRKPGALVLLSAGTVYGVHLGRWRNARTDDRGPPHVRPYHYPAGWYDILDRAIVPVGSQMPDMAWIAPFPVPPSHIAPQEHAADGGGASAAQAEGDSAVADGQPKRKQKPREVKS